MKFRHSYLKKKSNKNESNLIFERKAFIGDKKKQQHTHAAETKYLVSQISPVTKHVYYSFITVPPWVLDLNVKDSVVTRIYFIAWCEFHSMRSHTPPAKMHMKYILVLSLHTRKTI